jgi:CxxC-x17-CxxC domain-containing protein
MDYSDKVLKCADCGQEFIFTAGEQLFFQDRQFKNDPKRCKSCKAKRAGQYSSSRSGGSSRPETRTNCSQCGTETTVPFKPTQGRPVLCRQCFQTKKVAMPGSPAAGPPPVQA